MLIMCGVGATTRLCSMYAAQRRPHDDHQKHGFDNATHDLSSITAEPGRLPYLAGHKF